MWSYSTLLGSIGEGTVGVASLVIIFDQTTYYAAQAQLIDDVFQCVD